MLTDCGLNASRADAIWDTICYHGANGEVFKTADIRRSLIREGWKGKTTELYFNRFVIWALDHPDEFSGPRSRITRVGFGEYRLEDNPER
jgi:hypothetical protein